MFVLKCSRDVTSHIVCSIVEMLSERRFVPSLHRVQAISKEQPRTLPEMIPIIHKEQIHYTMMITTRLEQKV